MRIWRLVLTAIALAAPLGACGPDGQARTETDSLLGTYTLVQIDSLPVPAPGKHYVIAGNLTLNPDGSHRQSITFGENDEPKTTYSYTGGYTLIASGIAMSNDGRETRAFVREARREGSTLIGKVWNEPGTTFIYRK